jgi:hypothetical protein
MGDMQDLEAQITTVRSAYRSYGLGRIPAICVYAHACITLPTGLQATGPEGPSDFRLYI